MIQKCKKDFMVDNQLLILNKMLPDKVDAKLKLFLYADMAIKKQIHFYFEKNMPDPNPSFLDKLRENNFENTFRDESFLYHEKLFNVGLIL